jgi:predicted RNA-binding Zn-ribbon protein involved in translation (DUF1610 family)
MEGAVNTSSQSCPSCGKANPAGSAFCSSCGAAIASTQSGAGTSGAACPSCGDANPAGSAFCRSCGAAFAKGEQPANLQAQQEPPARQSQQPGWWKRRKTSTKVAIAAVGSLIIVGAVLGGTLGSRHTDEIAFVATTTTVRATTTTVRATTTTTENPETAYIASMDSLVDILEDDEVLLQGLRNAINANSPQVPDWIVEQLQALPDSLETEYAGFQSLPVPSAYDRANELLVQAVDYMLQRIDVTYQGAVDRQDGLFKEAMAHFGNGFALEEAYDTAFWRFRRICPPH